MQCHVGETNLQSTQSTTSIKNKYGRAVQQEVALPNMWQSFFSFFTLGAQFHLLLQPYAGTHNDTTSTYISLTSARLKVTTSNKASLSEFMNEKAVFITNILCFTWSIGSYICMSLKCVEVPWKNGVTHAPSNSNCHSFCYLLVKLLL
jgi:hypothetical protein